jgi:hypothetical protein
LNGNELSISIRGEIKTIWNVVIVVVHKSHRGDLTFDTSLAVMIFFVVASMIDQILSY